MAQTFNFIVKISEQEPIQYVLDAQTIGIGRHPDNQIQILIAEVSGKHAELNQSETGYTITELGSSNGTKVNGTRIPTGEVVELNHGDDLLLGEAVKVEYLRKGEEPAITASPAAALAKKKLALPKKKLAVKSAAPPVPVATESPSVADAASPTVVLQNLTPPAVGAKTVSLSKKPLAPRKPGLVAPGVQLKPASPASPASEGRAKPAVKLAPRKLASPAPKSEAEPPATPVIAELTPPPLAEEKSKPAVKLAPRKLAPPAPKAAPAPEPEATVAELESAPKVEEKPKPAVKLAPRKLAPPAPKPEPEPKPEPQPEPPVGQKPKPAVKLAPRKLASPAQKAPPEGELQTESSPAPVAEDKPKPAVKLAPRKLASPSPRVEKEPHPQAETGEPQSTELDQNSKGVTLIRKAAALEDPEASPLLKKKDGSDEDPPSLAKKEEVADVQLKKANPVVDDSPPKLVVPQKNRLNFKFTIQQGGFNNSTLFV